MEYHLLNLGLASSVVRSVLIARWGTQVRVECIYDPLEEQKEYQLLFNDCSRVVMDVLPGTDYGEEVADLLGIVLGEPGGSRPAILTTDLFEMHITYGHFECIKGGEKDTPR